MFKAYEYRICPTKEQVSIFNKTLGLCRLYYNIIVKNKDENHKILIEGYKPTFTKFKPEALEWVKEIDTIPLTQTWMDIRGAYSNFYKALKSNKPSTFSHQPTYKCKRNEKVSFRYHIQNNSAYLSKKRFIRHTKIRLHTYPRIIAVLQGQVEEHHIQAFRKREMVCQDLRRT